MFDNMNIINQVAVLFLIMLLGVFVKKKRIINDEVEKGIIDLLLQITLPCMIISSFFNYSFSTELMSNVINLILYSFVIHVSLIFISKGLFHRYPNDIQSVLRFVAMFSNTAFMGFPILESLYGKEGIFYASIFNVPFRVLLWSVGVMMFTGVRDKKSLRNALLNPAVIAVLVGLVIFVFSIRVPQIIYKTVDMVGSVSTPMSMIVIGCMLADTEIKDMLSNVSIFYSAAIRLIAIPVASLFIMQFLGVKDILVNVSVILLAMPAGATTAILASKYNANAVFASKCVFVTTVLSILTIPLILALI